MDTVKLDCASLLLDVIRNRPVPTDAQGQPDRLKIVIDKCITKLAMNFWINIHGVDKKKHLPSTCGADIEKGLIKDLLNYTISHHGAPSFATHLYTQI